MCPLQSRSSSATLAAPGSARRQTGRKSKREQERERENGGGGGGGGGGVKVPAAAPNGISTTAVASCPFPKGSVSSANAASSIGAALAASCLTTSALHAFLCPGQLAAWQSLLQYFATCTPVACSLCNSLANAHEQPLSKSKLLQAGMYAADMLPQDLNVTLMYGKGPVRHIGELSKYCRRWTDDWTSQWIVDPMAIVVISIRKSCATARAHAIAKHCARRICRLCTVPFVHSLK